MRIEKKNYSTVRPMPAEADSRPDRIFFSWGASIFRASVKLSATICRPQAGICQKSGCLEDYGNGRRILLADDHPLVLERVTKFLQSAFDVAGVHTTVSRWSRRRCG
jgi:hypothetical protein